MAITKLPINFKLTEPLTCAICSVGLAFDKATAGLLNDQGHQAFVCVSHFSEVEKLITGWADFTVKERYGYLHQGQELHYLIYDAGSVMRGLIREENSFGANPGTKDLARHLYTRMNCGKVVIIAENPDALLPPMRKQWLKLARKVQKEVASTLNTTRIYELNEVIMRMHTLRFTTKWPTDGYEVADVYIATVDELLRWVPEANCRTLYVTCEIRPEQLHMVTAWMGRGGLVVECSLTARVK